MLKNLRKSCHRNKFLLRRGKSKQLLFQMSNAFKMFDITFSILQNLTGL